MTTKRDPSEMDLSSDDETFEPNFNREPNVRVTGVTREVRTETQTEEVMMEVTVGRVEGNVSIGGRPSNITFQQPVTLDPNATIEAVLQFMAQNTHIPREILDQLRVNVANNTTNSNAANTTTTKSQNNDNVVAAKNSESVKDTIANLFSSPLGEVTADGAITSNQNVIIHDKNNKNNKSKNSNDVEMQDGDSNSGGVRVEVGQTEDEEGNVKFTFKIRRVMSHKVEKVIDEGSHVMVKACSMTVACSVFLIIAWLVLDQAKIKWFASA